MVYALQHNLPFSANSDFLTLFPFFYFPLLRFPVFPFLVFFLPDPFLGHIPHHVLASPPDIAGDAPPGCCCCAQRPADPHRRPEDRHHQRRFGQGD
ncbi:hypothetical protein VTJ04DRAFT_403 [Mycothermus thermophilus]|uniref:uncharacterized protein n=1 Tax=Humicola insolens TaxID=85995 RepID=UPI003742535A